MGAFSMSDNFHDVFEILSNKKNINSLEFDVL